jgi:hypothetical protein
MNLVHFGPYFNVVSMFPFVSIQNTKPQVSVFLQTTPPPTESQFPIWDFMQSFFYFLETDQYGSDIFGSIDNVRILFYFILFYFLT